MTATSPQPLGTQPSRPPWLPWPVFPFKSVLTLFGLKNDSYGWQSRFQQMFPHATAAGIADGRHFPFCDDPDTYSAAICTWWAQKVAMA